MFTPPRQRLSPSSRHNSMPRSDRLSKSAIPRCSREALFTAAWNPGKTSPQKNTQSRTFFLALSQLFNYDDAHSPQTGTSTIRSPDNRTLRSESIRLFSMDFHEGKTMQDVDSLLSPADLIELVRETKPWVPTVSLDTFRITLSVRQTTACFSPRFPGSSLEAGVGEVFVRIVCDAGEHSLSQAKGSMPCCLAVAKREYSIAARSVPSCEPAKRSFLRPRATGRTAFATSCKLRFSTRLLSISTWP